MEFANGFEGAGIRATVKLHGGLDLQSSRTIPTERKARVKIIKIRSERKKMKAMRAQKPHTVLRERLAKLRICIQPSTITYYRKIKVYTNSDSTFSKLKELWHIENLST